MKDLKDLKIAICSDHAGYELKEAVKVKLQNAGATVTDYGTNSAESCDYPDYAHPMASAVEGGKSEFGVAICGSGNGISMTANKHQGIRAALCWNVELANLARQHNNANVLSLPARFIPQDLAFQIVDEFFKTDFAGGRHERRVSKIPLQK
jgi:ribose 5-phosphate isomerase B